MPITKKLTEAEEAYHAHWEATVRGSVHPNDWAAVKKHEDLAPPLPEAPEPAYVKPVIPPSKEA